MLLLRQVFPGQFYLVTRRGAQRQCLLRPDADTNNAFTYYLNEAAQRCQVEMAAGPLLAQAIKDLSELPPNAHERAVAEQILLGLQNALRKQPERNRKEQEFVVAMHKTWEEARAEARTEGRTEGRTEAQANAVLTALRVRGIAVSEAARKRILAQKELPRLERWLEKAIVATSLGEVIDDRAEDHSSKTRRPVAHKERSRRRSARVPAQR